MIHISLFSGIGGFDLAAQWMGWRNLVSCDINEFGNKVREYYWPNGYCHRDIKTLNYETIDRELSARFGTGWRDDDIILTGGFPCQPYSSAGKRLGKDDERHLWPEMLRVISEVKPTYIVGENVRGLTNWNGGVVFEEVCADLENIGYEVQPVLLPACAVGAPHRRDRIWFVAYNNGIVWGKRRQFKYRKQSRYGESNESCNTKIDGNAPNPNCDGQHQCHRNDEINSSEGGQYALGNTKPSDGDGDAADTSNTGFKQCGIPRQISKKERISSQQRCELGVPIKTVCNGFKPDWHNFPTQSPIRSGDDGLPTQLDGITFSKWRNESIKAYGNAVVPQLVYQIFKAIDDTLS